MREREKGRHAACASESGQTLAEYALILALLAVFVFGALELFGSQVQDLFSTIGSGVQKVIP